MPIRNAGVAGTVEARHISKLLELRQLENVTIEKIGRRMRKRRRRRAEPRWFAVRAIFAIQVEDQTSGLQDYEERINLVKAHSFDDAVRRLRKEFRLYATPYLNLQGEMVRWQFESVLDVYDTGEEEISASGTEVFSTIRRRRIRADRVWRPRRSS